jgi:hypothetical protein
VLPDILHGALLLLFLGTFIRITEYLMSQKYPNSILYKYLVFAY